MTIQEKRDEAENEIKLLELEIAILQERLLYQQNFLKSTDEKKVN